MPSLLPRHMGRASAKHAPQAPRVGAHDVILTGLDEEGALRLNTSEKSDSVRTKLGKSNKYIGEMVEKGESVAESAHYKNSRNLAKFSR